MAASVDQLNNATRDFVKKRAAMLMDNVFQNDPFLDAIKGMAQPFPGGTMITEPFVGRGLIGGGFAPSSKFDTTDRQTDQQFQFNIKTQYVGLTLDSFEVDVLNDGPSKLYSIVESKFSNSALTMGANMAMALYLPGDIAGSWIRNIQGLPMICNNGTTNAWTGTTYATYGGLSRTSGAWYSDTIKGQVEALSGPITYETLESSYMDVTFGSVMPNIGVTTPKMYSFVKNKFQTQQRFNDSSSPSVGFKGLDFQGAVLYPSRYCPGQAIAAKSTGPEAEFIKQTTKDSGTPLTAYPAVTGETLFWVNAREPYLNLYISSHPMWGLGFTGFKLAQDDVSYIGQQLLAWCLTSPGPRYHKEINAILS